MKLSKFYLPIMFQRCETDHYFKYENFCYKIQTHSSITLWIIFGMFFTLVVLCLMNIFTKLCLPTMFQRSDMDQSLHIKCVLQITKSTKSDSIKKTVHMPNFKHPCTSYFTKSPKCDNIYKLCLWMPEEQNCIILTS